MNWIQKATLDFLTAQYGFRDRLLYYARQIQHRKLSGVTLGDMLPNDLEYYRWFGMPTVESLYDRMSILPVDPNNMWLDYYTIIMRDAEPWRHINIRLKNRYDISYLNDVIVPASKNWRAAKHQYVMEETERRSKANARKFEDDARKLFEDIGALRNSLQLQRNHRPTIDKVRRSHESDEQYHARLAQESNAGKAWDRLYGTKR